ncbi:MAG TPA: XRE family transcriptional regulator [Kiloniellales bacterium]|nr:XRE family transcriptional regulator [Kiloniellales bacterium]
MRTPRRRKKSAPAPEPTRRARAKLCLIEGGPPKPGRSAVRGAPPPPIGGKLREVRQVRNLTLGEVEALCGISKSMLSQIERGKVNPTFATLWHITRSLGIGIGELLGEVQSVPEAVRRFEHIKVVSTPTITSADGLCTTRILSPRRYALPFEWYEIALKPGGSLRAHPHGNGEWEHATVVSGSIVQEIGEDEVPLAEGETIRYAADQPHGLRNEGRTDAKVLLVVVPMKDLERHKIPHGPIDDEG